jgi:hypothetical protein
MGKVIRVSHQRISYYSFSDMRTQTC